MTQPNTKSFSTGEETPHKCVFCGKPTEYYRAGIGYICAKCLGEYEGARLGELCRRSIEPTPITPWHPSWYPPDTTYPGIPLDPYSVWIQSG